MNLSNILSNQVDKPYTIYVRLVGKKSQQIKKRGEVRITKDEMYDALEAKNAIEDIKSLIGKTGITVNNIFVDDVETFRVSDEKGNSFSLIRTVGAGSEPVIYEAVMEINGKKSSSAEVTDPENQDDTRNFIDDMKLSKLFNVSVMQMLMGTA